MSVAVLNWRVETLGMASEDDTTKPDHQWIVTHTVHANRRNVFSFGEAEAYHVGTIISGSRSKLVRFDGDVQLIAAAPELKELLEEAVKLLDANSALRERIQATLQKVRG